MGQRLYVAKLSPIDHFYTDLCTGRELSWQGCYDPECWRSMAYFQESSQNVEQIFHYSALACMDRIFPTGFASRCYIPVEPLFLSYIATSVVLNAKMTQDEFRPSSSGILGFIHAPVCFVERGNVTRRTHNYAPVYKIL